MTRNETAAQPEKPKAAPRFERKREARPADAPPLRDQRADVAPPPELQKAPEPAPPPSQDAVGNVAQSASGLRFDEGARAASPLSAFALQSPEQWLQGIADLRKQGRHQEADRELAEFRKRHPDYKIPPTMRERVERR
jgi:hypothetical protein